jgi:mono/diheme cytochrome c family protein
MSADKPTSEPNAPLPIAGILAEFDGAEAVKAAAAKVREAGYRRWDVHSPYPIHGIERAMGVRHTFLPWLVLGAGTTGVAAALFMQWWTNAVSYTEMLPGYPLIISGKPFFSLPANVPIIFELMVLFSAIAAFLGVLVLNLLPQFWHWTMGGSRFAKSTTDGFFISIDAAGGKSGTPFDEAAVRSLLESAGATSVEICRDVIEQDKRIPWQVKWLLAAIAVAALVPPLVIAGYRYSTKSLPRIHPIQDLDFQEKYKPQAASPLFADGRAMRLPVPGTIAEGQLHADAHLYRGLVDDKPATTFPTPVTKAMMLRGQERFGIYCAACHGLQGEGGNTGIVSVRAFDRMSKGTDTGWVLPLSLHKEEVRKQAVGQYFATITDGVRTMPSYGSQIPAEDRWAIILYIRALQKSQDATINDVPEELRKQLR